MSKFERESEISISETTHTETASTRSSRSQKRLNKKNKNRFKKVSVRQHCRNPNLQRYTNVQRFEGMSPSRLIFHDLVTHKYFEGGILGIILLNTVLITLQTDKTLQANYGWYFSVVDAVFLGIYSFELTLKLIVWRKAFFQNSWNNFDFLIVMLSIIEVLWLAVMGSLAGFDPKIFRMLRVFRALKAVRALRVLRTITFFRSLQMIVTALIRSLSSMGYILLLVLLVMYIFGIIGVTSFKASNPENFGNLWASLFSLFQLITLDDWFQLYEMESTYKGTTIIYLMVFIVLETFIFINLFIAVIVSNLEILQHSNRQRQAKEAKERNLQLKREELQRSRAAAEQRNQQQEEDSLSNGAVESIYNEVKHHGIQASLTRALAVLATMDHTNQQMADLQGLMDALVDATEYHNRKQEEEDEGDDLT